MKLQLINAFDEWQDFELMESGHNAALRSIVLTLESGRPCYAMARRSYSAIGEFGEKAEFQIGRKGLAALAEIAKRQGLLV